MTETSTLLKQAQQMKNHFRVFAELTEFLTGVQRLEGEIVGMRAEREKLRDEIEELDETKTKKGKALAAATKRATQKTEGQDKSYAEAEVLHKARLDDVRKRVLKAVGELETSLVAAQAKHAVEITRMEDENADMVDKMNTTTAARGRLKREVGRL